MKAKVLIPFRDKENKKEYKKGDIIDVSVKRFNEITKAGKYIQLIEDDKQPVKV